ncbi:MAG: hypothetical protein QOE03_4105 [Micromonosporaceae bacterium]|nr:hypothetical protein [Micromonosporaceae bacterium]
MTRPVPRDLVIVGAGGFARETAATVRALADRWRLLGFLDDDPTLHGRSLGGVPVLGGTDRLAGLPAVGVVVCTGNPGDYGSRARIVRRLGLPAGRYATITHPSADVGTGCVVGPGTVVLTQAVLTVDVQVGAHVAVMPQVVLTHDTVVGDFVTIASGARLGGGVRLERGCYIGAGAMVREGLTVGAGSLVGMGSVVIRDVPPGQVRAGNPARFRRAADPAESAADPGEPVGDLGEPVHSAEKQGSIHR